VWISPDPSPAFPAPRTHAPQYKPATNPLVVIISIETLVAIGKLAARGSGSVRGKAERGRRADRFAALGGGPCAEMLAVFDPAVAPSPEGLRQPGAAGGDSAAGLADRFREARPDAVTVNLGGSGAMAYSSSNQSPLLPR